MMPRLIGFALAVMFSIACSAEVELAPAERDERPEPAQTRWPSRPELCARASADAIRDVFCADVPPQLRSLNDLLRVLSLKPASDVPEDPNASLLLSSVAVLGHSTALSGHLVSPINPRVILMGTGTFLAFQRGVQRVELISRIHGSDGLNFYLLEFEQACNESRAGCSPGDLYTAQIESDWLRTRIRDDEELKNTPFDCRQCHQRSRERATLLMRELESPWTHFFLPPGPSLTPGVSGSDLLQDYVDAKGDEPYAGFLLHTISEQTPFFLEGATGPEQPLLFDAPRIDAERYPYGPDGYAKQPQPSPTWERAYEAFQRGEQLALPYLDARATDPGKQAALTEAYRSYRAGELPAAELPELGDIFPDEPRQRARRGSQTEPEATPEELLIQACGACHNDVLDQSLSRARFNIRVTSHDRRQLDQAIDRIQRRSGALGAMPPSEARQLDAGARKRLIEYLKGKPSALDPAGRLDRAARLGMAGGAGTKRASGLL